MHLNCRHEKYKFIFMKSYSLFYIILFLTILLFPFYTNSQHLNKSIKCYLLKNNYVINKREELFIPIKLLNPKKWVIDLGKLLPEDKNKTLECVPTKYKVLYRKSKINKFRTRLFVMHLDNYSLNSLQFFSPSKIVYAYIPKVLSEEGYYKFEFSIYYFVGKNKKMYVTRTQWVNIRVL